MPKAFTEQEREMIRRRLLEQGHRLFSGSGLRKTSVEELAAAVGISKGAFYLFYSSKEALFMDVVEEAETHFREQILAALDRPGPSPRARLAGAFREAVTMWRAIPILRAFSSEDYELIYRRVPPEQIQAHMEADRAFLERMAARCQSAGIPVTLGAKEISGMMYVLFLSSLHQDEFGPEFPATIARLTELIAAYCLGEIKTA